MSAKPDDPEIVTLAVKARAKEIVPIQAQGPEEDITGRSSHITMAPELWAD